MMTSLLLLIPDTVLFIDVRFLLFSLFIQIIYIYLFIMYTKNNAKKHKKERKNIQKHLTSHLLPFC